MTSFIALGLSAFRLCLVGITAGGDLFRRRLRRARSLADAGMSTAEYAVGTVAAVAFAVVLYKVVRSPAVATALSGIIRSALHTV